MRDSGNLPSQGGLTSHPLHGLFGVGSYLAQRGQRDTGALVGRARQLGATWVREEITASALHTSADGPYDWRPYDRVVDAERASGLHVLGLLDYSNTWGLGSHGMMPHEDIRQLARDYADFAYAAARHFRGRIHYWQVWNEPNISQFWHPVPNPHDYAIVLAEADLAIKRADPSAQVVLAGTSGVDLDFLRTVAQDTTRFDVVAVHPYRASPESDLLRQIHALQELGKPVWFTEIGWPAGADCSLCAGIDDQESFLVRFYALAAAAGVERIFWYDLRDDRYGIAPEETHFGLLRRDLSGKPSARAYAFLTRALGGAAFRTATSTGGDGVYALRFDRRGHPVDIIWNTGATAQTTRMSWPASTAVVLSTTGEVIGNVPVVDGEIVWTVEPDGRPVYIMASPPRRPLPAFGPVETPVPHGATKPAQPGSPHPRPTATLTALPVPTAAATDRPRATATVPVATGVIATVEASPSPAADPAPVALPTPSLPVPTEPAPTPTASATSTSTPTATASPTPPTSPMPTTSPTRIPE